MKIKQTLKPNRFNYPYLFVDKKERSQCDPAEIVTDADDADDFALLPNASALAKSLLLCLEQAA